MRNNMISSPVHATTPTVVVVDVQTGFFDAIIWPEQYDLFLQAVSGVVTAAIRREWPVVINEMDFCGSTYPQVIKPLKAADYRHWRVMPKPRLCADGSQYVKQSCAQSAYGTRLFCVCGCYTNACVEATVKGLGRLFPSGAVVVVQDACLDIDPDWQRFEALQGVHLATTQNWDRIVSRMMPVSQ